MNRDWVYAFRRTLWYNNPVKLLVEQTLELSSRFLLLPKNVWDFKRLASLSCHTPRRSHSKRRTPLDYKV
jgi:hypothetical protein